MVDVGSTLCRRIGTVATVSASLLLTSGLATSCGPDDPPRTAKVSSSPAPVQDDVFASQTSDVIEMAERSGGAACDLAATSPLLVSPPGNARQRLLLADAIAAWSTAATPHLDAADSSLLESAITTLRAPSPEDDDTADADARAVIERFVGSTEASCAVSEPVSNETLPTVP